MLTPKLFRACRHGLLIITGKPITQDGLFRYTNGRFLVNEKHETAKRYVEFDVDQLCKMVASIPAVSSPVSKIDKVEGGFNKALILTMENGTRAVAKIPFPNAGPSKFCTASEVAVLTFVKTHTAIPVPGVLAWSSDANNPIGVEYIILEMVPGKQLSEAWGEMNELDQFELIQSLSRLESQLTSIKFPAYGNLYFRQGKPEKAIDLDSYVDPEALYCIGPVYNDSWPGGSGEHLSWVDLSAGPWTGLSELGIGLCQRGTWHTDQTRSDVAVGPHFGSSEDHRQILEAARKVIRALESCSLLDRYCKPTLWHTDLHMGNIFVSEEDPRVIVGLIDWQFTSILPLFVQARWPIFLNPPEGYQTGPFVPDVPRNFHAMYPDEQELFVSMRDQARKTKCYEAALARNHRQAFLAMTQPEPCLRDLFTRGETTHKDGIVPLRACLVGVADKWQSMGLPGTCPFEISLEDRQRHEDEVGRYRDWHKLRACTQELLGSDDEGWVSPQLDFEAVQVTLRQLFDVYLEKYSAEMSDEAARRLWFYIERERE
ncbi:MAG: hypothetical protein M1819_001965 [Sarea resinae]|nr:MAG: hypothetical protein M1819_001965 [Sarea resinae]